MRKNWRRNGDGWQQGLQTCSNESFWETFRYRTCCQSGHFQHGQNKFRCLWMRCWLMRCCSLPLPIEFLLAGIVWKKHQGRHLNFAAGESATLNRFPFKWMMRKEQQTMNKAINEPTASISVFISEKKKKQMRKKEEIFRSCMLNAPEQGTNKLCFCESLAFNGRRLNEELNWNCVTKKGT